jgi:hypothetical protein
MVKYPKDQISAPSYAVWKESKPLCWNLIKRKKEILGEYQRGTV